MYILARLRLTVPAAAQQKLRLAVSNLLCQDCGNLNSYAGEGRGLVVRETCFEACPNLRATLELTL